MRIGLVGAGRIGAFHAQALRDLQEVAGVMVADADAGRAEALGLRVGIDSAPDVTALLAGGVDGVVIAAATPAHATLLHRVIDAGLPVFCEKPVAPDVSGTWDVIGKARAAGVPLQVGFQRRFDAGYRAVREAVRAGRLGWLHALRAVTADQTPPPAEYLPASGGIFRDCGVHDYDAVGWVTGHRVVEVYATGANRGASCFTDCGDVDTGIAVLRLDDDTLATCTATRYNGAGYDVRLEVAGSLGMVGAGLSEGVPLTSAETGVEWPRGPAFTSFTERFRAAYVEELRAFTDVVAGRIDSPVPGEEALEALLVAEAAEISRREGRTVRMEEVRA